MSKSVTGTAPGMRVGTKRVPNVQRRSRVGEKAIPSLTTETHGLIGRLYYGLPEMGN